MTRRTRTPQEPSEGRQATHPSTNPRSIKTNVHEQFAGHSRKVALIHIAKAQVGMDESTYRAMLHELAGVASSKDLDPAGFLAVMRRFATLGFVSSSGAAAAPVTTHVEGKATAAQIAFIRGLWRRWHGADNARALRHFLEGRFHVSDLRFADTTTAQKAIEGLKAMLDRKTTASEQPKVPSGTATTE